MGSHIRAFGWVHTPLGPPELWPAPLRTAVRVLLTTNHPVFLFWGAELRCFYNDAYARSLGPEQHPSMLGARGREAWADIWHVIAPQIDQVMSGQGATWNENQLVPITRHGQRDDVYWTYSYSPLDDDNAPNGVGGVLVLVTETTDQVRVADRLRKAEARWRELLAQAPGFVCILSGPMHVFEFANTAYLGLIGRDHVLGLALAQALPWAAVQGFVALLDRVYQTGEPYTGRTAPVRVPVDVTAARPVAPVAPVAVTSASPATTTMASTPEVRSAEGPAQLRFLDFVYQPIRNDAGQVTGIFVSGFDATDRKRAEEQLQESEERLRLARDAAALGIYDVDLVGQHIALDARVRELCGFEDHTVVDRNTVLNRIHGDDRAAATAAVAQAMNAEGDGHLSIECRVLSRRDEPSRWVQVTGQATFVDGRAVRLVGTLQDVTVRRNLDARKNEFLAVLSHELRNPLAPVLHAVELMKLCSNDPATMVRARTIIERQVRHMVRLVGDLLDVARIERNRMVLERREVSVGELIATAVEVAMPHLQSNGHQLKLEVAAPTLLLWVDPVRIAQVLSNLLINACKYSIGGSDIVLAALPVAAGHDTVVLQVRDHGIGIDPQVFERVFDMFSQVDGALGRAQGGLGIGLALSRRLVEMHGGTLQVSSDGAGQGSVFTVQLPLPGRAPAATIIRTD